MPPHSAGEPKAHLEIARKYQVAFRCVAGSCGVLNHTHVGGDRRRRRERAGCDIHGPFGAVFVVVGSTMQLHESTAIPLHRVTYPCLIHVDVNAHVHACMTLCLACPHVHTIAEWALESRCCGQLARTQ